MSLTTKSLEACQKSAYLRIVKCLWDNGPEEAHQKYPAISARQFAAANAYYNSKRCDGCWCGYCVGLNELASNLDQSPDVLQSIADLAIQLGAEDFDNQ